MPTFFSCDLIKFLTGTLSWTKNKSTDKIWTQLSTIFMKELLYTYFWKRMPMVFAFDQYPAGRCKSVKNDTCNCCSLQWKSSPVWWLDAPPQSFPDPKNWRTRGHLNDRSACIGKPRNLFVWSPHYRGSLPTTESWNVCMVSWSWRALDHWSLLDPQDQRLNTCNMYVASWCCIVCSLELPSVAHLPPARPAFLFLYMYFDSAAIDVLNVRMCRRGWKNTMLSLRRIKTMHMTQPTCVWIVSSA